MKVFLFSTLLISFSVWGDETSFLYEPPSSFREKIKPEYEACKDADLSSLSFSEKNNSKEKTEGEFCFSCLVSKAFSFGEVKKVDQTLQSKVFRENLQKRVIGQIQAKIYQTKIIQKCIEEDRDWLRRQEGLKHVDWPLIRAVCRKNTKELKASIKENWPQMRINLALSSPAVKEDRILSADNTWFDPTPSHPISDFNDLPRLTLKEKTQARKLYVETLAETPLEKLSASEFKQRMYRGKSLHPPLSGERYLTQNDRFRLKEATGNLQEQAQTAYFEIMSNMPVLGFLKKGNPNKEELDEAYGKIEKELREDLEKAKDPEVAMSSLLYYRPLVEELLRDNRKYCLAAEKARIQAEKEENLWDLGMIGAGATAALPCFKAGVWGAAVCLAGGIAVGFWGYKELEEEREAAFGRLLTGKEFETMASLNEKEREAFLAKLFLPLGAWGTTAVPARAASGAIARAVRNSPKALAAREWRINYFKEAFENFKSGEIKRKVSIEELQLPARTREVQALKAHGFDSGYTGGIDEMNEMIAVGKKLRELKADPYNTHFDYFVEKMKTHIEFIDEGFLNSMQREQMDLLKQYVKTATGEESFTYEKFIRYNEMLAYISDPSTNIKGAGRSIGDASEIISRFPEEILMPSIEPSGVMTMNRGIDEDIHIAGVIRVGRFKKTIRFDNDYGGPARFWDHDTVHAREVSRAEFQHPSFKRKVRNIRENIDSPS